MRNDFLLYEEMCKYLVTNEEALSHICLCNRSLLDFLISEKNFVFFFISVDSDQEEKAMKERLLVLACDLKVLKRMEENDGSQKRKKCCNGSLLDHQLAVLVDQLICLFLS
jgi:hypothetical protein